MRVLLAGLPEPVARTVRGALPPGAQAAGAGDRPDLAVLGPREADPIEAAQRIHREHPRCELVLVSSPEEREGLCDRLRTAPFVGQSTRCVAGEDASLLAETVRQAVQRAQTRQLHQADVEAVRTRMADASPGGILSPHTILHQILDHVPIGILVLDGEHCIASLNGPAQAILRPGIAPILGTPLTRHVREESLEPLAQLLAAADEEAERPFKGLVELADGHDVHLTVTRRTDPAGGTSLIVIVQDVTTELEAVRALERHSAELARSNEELEQFGYAVSHDLQEPLRVISSFTELLQRRHGEELSESGREYLDFIADGSRRMHEMIRDLLQYSRVQTRGRPFQEVDLEPVLDEVLDNLQVLLAESGGEVLREPLPTVRADRTQMVQLLQNLVGNGLKFHPPDRAPRIRVDAATLDDGWRVRVHDNGIGIGREQGDRIFRVFQRLHGRGQYPGTGVGLSIARRIVERHGGAIGYDSVPGEGTTFWFTLPR